VLSKSLFINKRQTALKKNSAYYSTHLFLFLLPTLVPTIKGCGRSVPLSLGELGLGTMVDSIYFSHSSGMGVWIIGLGLG
jgi:hypothetical protein